MWQQPGSFSPLMPPHAYPQYPQNIPMMPDNFKGHQIPMLSDGSHSQNSDEMPYQQPPLQPIPPTPQATLPQTGGIDWTIISSCSPEEIVKTDDIETLTAIIQSFIHAQFTQTEAQLMPNPLTSKFFHILQIAVRHLLNCQAELKESLEESLKAEQLLKAKLKNLSSSLLRAKDETKKMERIKETTEKCIVCGRRFKNIGYLDGHVQRRHGALMPAWRSLRTGQLQGMEDFTEQIQILRQEVAKAHHELEKRARQTEKAPISHIVSHSDEQVRLMRELVAKQDEILNQAKLNEEKQLNFRKEMRNQLDDAVFALQDAQKQLDVQAARISQIPLIPPTIPSKQNEPIQPDELGSSLTEQLMKPGLEKQRISFKLDKMLNNDIPPSPFKDDADSKKDDSWRHRLTNTPDEESEEDKKKATTKPSATAKPSVTKDEEEEGQSEGQASGRDKKHQSILDKLQKTNITSSDEEEKKKAKIAKKFASKRDQIEDLLKRGKMLVNHKININEEENKDFSIATIQEATLHQVDVKLAELKRLRPYAKLSVPFVAKKMAEDNNEFRQMYNKLSAFVGSEVPYDPESIRKDVFRDRKTRFPMLPPVKKLTQQQFLLQKQKELKGKKKKGKDESDKKGGVPDIPDEIIEVAGKKLPLRQRLARERPRFFPDDQDIIIVDHFSSEVRSDSSVPYQEDPDYYKQVHSKDKKEKDFEQLHISSPSSSSAIQPLAAGDDDTKVFNLSDYSNSSDNEREKQNQKSKKPENNKKVVKKISMDSFSDDNDNDGNVFAFSSGSDAKAKSKMKSKNDFEFEEEEEDVSFDNSTQKLPIKSSTKTMTYNVKTAGSSDFDVTKKQSLKNDSGSDVMFNLSDFSSGDEISPDEEDFKKKSKRKK